MLLGRTQTGFTPLDAVTDIGGVGWFIVSCKGREEEGSEERQLSPERADLGQRRAQGEWGLMDKDGLCRGGIQLQEHILSPVFHKSTVIIFHWLELRVRVCVLFLFDGVLSSFIPLNEADNEKDQDEQGDAAHEANEPSLSGDVYLSACHSFIPHDDSFLRNGWACSSARSRTQIKLVAWAVLEVFQNDRGLIGSQGQLLFWAQFIGVIDWLIFEVIASDVAIVVMRRTPFKG